MPVMSSFPTSSAMDGVLAASGAGTVLKYLHMDDALKRLDTHAGAQSMRPMHLSSGTGRQLVYTYGKYTEELDGMPAGGLAQQVCARTPLPLLVSCAPSSHACAAMYAHLCMAADCAPAL